MVYQNQLDLFTRIILQPVGRVKKKNKRRHLLKKTEKNNNNNKALNNKGESGMSNNYGVNSII